MIHGNMVGGASLAQTYMLQDEYGNEVPAVLVEQKTVFDATPNDIRAGKVAATEQGVTRGIKEIPAYHTTEGVRAIPAGSEFTIPLPDGKRYEFTKLQVIICDFNTSLADSVAAVKVCVDGDIYPVGSTVAIASAAADHEAGAINLGIVNEGTTPFIVRYFTYKEEQ